MARRKVPLAAVREPRNALELVNPKVEAPEFEQLEKKWPNIRKTLGTNSPPRVLPAEVGPYVRAQHSIPRAQREAYEDLAMLWRRKRGHGKADAGEVLRAFHNACFEKWARGQR